jgi:hypothetical protein
MGYAAALEKAWDTLSASTDRKRLSARLLADWYDIDVEKRTVFSASGDIPAKDYTAILLLHYLTAKLGPKGLAQPSGEWVGFGTLEGGEGYYPTFRKRTIERILRKYGQAPDDLLAAAGHLPMRRAQVGDVGIVLDALDGIPILITLWKGDEEFGADANMLFDKTISRIFCTEDTVVLAEIITHSL